ncbi:HAD family hydrolase [Nesterenkonia populi]|uniref:HAD family hydrolase n=1 Tax=Nesterenkonia populi TaxID=1591087 RepID=UPI0011BE2861|nr:HAD family phosphatase [Nesterenkonia populi]
MSAEARSAALRLSTAEGPVELGVSAAVFDCDGLLVDSESVWLEMISAWLADRGVAGAAAADFHGLSVDDTATRLAALPQVRGDAAAVAAELTRRYSQLLQEGTEPMPGAVEVFTGLASAVPTAVASNGLRPDVRLMLRASGLWETAQAVCTVDEVASGKPAPDLYREACRRLGVAPEEAAAFEDSAAGASAAMAAGLTVVGVNADPDVSLPCHHRLTALTAVELAAAAG